jgi:diguanylate cyclase (GGDEF)-like protein/PAS domain S-box-containing protein
MSSAVTHSQEARSAGAAQPSTGPFGTTLPNWAGPGLVMVLALPLHLALRDALGAAAVVVWLPAVTLAIVLWFGRKPTTTPAAAANPTAVPLFEQLRLPMLLLDRQGQIIAPNAAFTRECGFKAAELGRTRLRDLLSHRQDASGLAHLWNEARTHGQWQGSTWLRRRDGSAFDAWLSLSALPAVADPHGPAFVATVCNISSLRQHDEQLRHLAFHDPLTGLPNRRLLTRDLTRAIGRARRHGHGLALMFIDLDHFKWVNDSHGHAVGDRVLAEVAARLQRTVRAGDALARLGGDEFMLVLEDMASRHDAAGMARKAIAAIAQPIEVDGRSVMVSASIGIAQFPDAGQDAAAPMHAADLAMYRAKGYGRHTFAFSLSGAVAPGNNSPGADVTQTGVPLAQYGRPPGRRGFVKATHPTASRRSCRLLLGLEFPFRRCWQRTGRCGQGPGHHTVCKGLDLQCRAAGADVGLGQRQGRHGGAAQDAAQFVEGTGTAGTSLGAEVGHALDLSAVAVRKAAHGRRQVPAPDRGPDQHQIGQ